MSSDIGLGCTVAERVRILEPDGQVVARIGLPSTPDDFPNESWCPIQIVGLGRARIRHIVGIDSVQSLGLAMQWQARRFRSPRRIGAAG